MDSATDSRKLDLEKLLELSAAMHREIQALRGKEVVLVVGKTGSGKSTVINYLLKNKLVKTIDEETDEVLIQLDGMTVADTDDTNCSDKQFAEIGHEFISETLYPKGFQTESGFLLCDTAGFGDNRSSENNAAAYLAVQMIIQSVAILKGIIVVISADDFKGRATVLNETLSLLKRLIMDNENCMNNFQNSVVFVFTHADDGGNKVKTDYHIQGLLKKAQYGLEKQIRGNPNNENLADSLALCKIMRSRGIKLVVFDPLFEEHEDQFKDNPVGREGILNYIRRHVTGTSKEDSSFRIEKHAGQFKGTPHGKDYFFNSVGGSGGIDKKDNAFLTMEHEDQFKNKPFGIENVLNYNEQPVGILTEGSAFMTMKDEGRFSNDPFGRDDVLNSNEQPVGIAEEDDVLMVEEHSGQFKDEPVGICAFLKLEQESSGIVKENNAFMVMENENQITNNKLFEKDDVLKFEEQFVRIAKENNVRAKEHEGQFKDKPFGRDRILYYLSQSNGIAKEDIAFRVGKIFQGFSDIFCEIANSYLRSRNVIMDEQKRIHQYEQKIEDKKSEISKLMEINSDLEQHGQKNTHLENLRDEQKKINCEISSLNNQIRNNITKHESVSSDKYKLESDTTLTLVYTEDIYSENAVYGTVLKGVVHSKTFDHSQTFPIAKVDYVGGHYSYTEGSSQEFSPPSYNKDRTHVKIEYTGPSHEYGHAEFRVYSERRYTPDSKCQIQRYEDELEKLEVERRELKSDLEKAKEKEGNLSQLIIDAEYQNSRDTKSLIESNEKRIEAYNKELEHFSGVLKESMQKFNLAKYTLEEREKQYQMLIQFDEIVPFEEQTIQEFICEYKCENAPSSAAASSSQ